MSSRYAPLFRPLAPRRVQVPAASFQTNNPTNPPAVLPAAAYTRLGAAAVVASSILSRSPTLTPGNAGRRVQLAPLSVDLYTPRRLAVKLSLFPANAVPA